jgi:DNA-binding transcriptional ArsR family regulator
VVTNAGVLLEAIGEPTRRALFERLAVRSCAVSELAAELPVTASAVSQHLKILKAAGLVTDRAVGTRRIYSVDPAALAVIRQYFDSFWTASMSSFRAAAEQPEQEKK